MNNLAKDLQDIIYEYKYQLEFSECLKEINEIEYSIETDWEDYVWFTRTHKNKETRGYLSPYQFSGLAIFVDENLTIHLKNC